MHKKLLKDIGEKELIKRLAKFMPNNQVSDDCGLVKSKKNKQWTKISSKFNKRFIHI